VLKDPQADRERIDFLSKEISGLGGRVNLLGLQRLSKFCKASPTLAPDFGRTWACLDTGKIISMNQNCGKFNIYFMSY
jgi:hypothetical protein